MGLGPHAFREFAQPVGVGAVGRSDDQHKVAMRGELLYRVLPILRGVADVVLARTLNVRKPLAQTFYNTLGVIHGQRGLSDIGQLLRVPDHQFGHLLFILHEVYFAAGRTVVLPHGALYLGVATMPDKHALTTLQAVTRHFHMYFGHQWTGSIEHLERSLARLFPHGTGYTMGAENNDTVVGHLMQFIDEQRATRTQVVHDEAVVHDLVPHIDRRPEHLQSAIDYVDGTIHAGTESARVGQFDLWHHSPSLLARSVHIHWLHAMNQHIKQDCTARKRMIKVDGHIRIVKRNHHTRHLATGRVGK